jgi:RimJ/RimL family protein N-acetyltransferase
MHVPSRNEMTSRPLATARFVLAPLDVHDARDLLRAVDASRDHLGHWLAWVAACTAGPDAVHRCAESQADWDQARALRFAVRDTTTLQLLGVVTLEAIVPAHANADLSFWVRADALRQGVATEATGAAVELAFHRMGLHRLRATIAASNVAARGVLASLAFRFESVVRGGEWHDGRRVDGEQYALLAR